MMDNLDITESQSWETEPTISIAGKSFDEQKQLIRNLPNCPFTLHATYGECGPGIVDEVVIYKGCRLVGTEKYDPEYDLFERFVRWMGSLLQLDRLSSFHDRGEPYICYSFTTESIEYPD